MSNLFDLQHELELVKHKATKGLVKSKSLAWSNGNRSSNNRLLALEQSFSSPTFSSAYTLPEQISMLKKVYLIAGGGELNVRTRHELASLQKDMVSLLPEFWKQGSEEPSEKIVKARCLAIKKEIEAGKQKTKELFLNKNFESQLLFWAAVLKESIDEILSYSSFIDDSNVFKQMIINSTLNVKLENQTRNPLFNPLKDINPLASSPPPKDFVANISEKVVKELTSKQLIQALEKLKIQDSIINPLVQKQVDTNIEKYLLEMDENSPAYKVAEKETGIVLTASDRKRFKKEQKGLIKLAQNSSFIDFNAPSDNTGIEENLQAILKLALTVSPQYKKESIAKFKDNQERVTNILTQLQISLGSLAYCDASKELKLDAKKLSKTKAFLEKENNDGIVSTLVASIDASVGTWAGPGKKVGFKGKDLEQFFGTTHTTQNFLTTSNAGDWIPACITISGFVYKIGKKDWDGLKQQLTPEHPVSATATIISKIKQGLDATSAVNGLAKGKILAQNTAVVITKVSAITGIVLGVVELGFVASDIKKIYSLETRFKTLIEKDNGKNLRKLLNAKIKKGAKRHRINNVRYKPFDKILQKYGHRTHYKVISGVGAVSSIVAGSLTTAIAFGAAVGIANIWNPVGWVCVGAALITGVGLLSYKGVKKLTYKKYKLNKLKKQFKDVPNFCKTSGDYWRYKAAKTIFMASILEDEEVKLLSEEIQKDVAVGRAFAIVLFGAAIKNASDRKKASEQAYQTAAQMGVSGIMAFIKG